MTATSKEPVRFREGDTTPRKFRLTLDGQPEQLAGMVAVEAVVYTRLDAAVDMTGDLTVLDPATGTVQLLPDPADFVSEATPHRLRFKVTDALGRVGYYPDDGPVPILVQDR